MQAASVTWLVNAWGGGSRKLKQTLFLEKFLHP